MKLKARAKYFFCIIIFHNYFRTAMMQTMKHTKGTKKIFSKEEAA